MRAKIRDFVDSVTAEVRLVVVAKQESLPMGHLAVPIGTPAGNGCIFVYGDTRELPEQARDQLANKMCEEVLVILCLQVASLTLFFHP